MGDWEGPRRHFITCLAVFRDQKRHDPAFAGPQVDPDIGGRIGIRLLSESRFPNPQSRPYRSSLLDMSSSATTSAARSEEHTSELQSLMRISYDVFCLKKKNIKTQMTQN